MLWLDVDTFEVVSERSDLHAADFRSATISPDRALIATGSSDGEVRIWDSQTGALVHEVTLEEVAVHGLAFLGDSSLGVTLSTGDILLVTYDTHRLVELARQSLARGFSERECAQFNFKTCPTLEEMKATGD